jgi:DNA-methyltransferase (dcm)
MTINVLSLFDGISCGQVALERLNIKYNYFASEIDKKAIKVTQHNYPNTIQLGNVEKHTTWQLPKIDLLIGGSPCQGFSIAGRRKKLEDERSKLFYKYVEVLEQLKPTYFLLENVVMDKESQNLISSLLKVQPIKINSKLVSYQNRNRLYWTNIPNIQQPKDKNINFQDFKDTDKTYCDEFKVNPTQSRLVMWGNGINGKCKNVTHSDKINCITLKQDRWKNSGLIKHDNFCRYLTTRELELGQTLPIGYTKILTKRQSENVIGNAFTVDVIVHLLNELKEIYNC